MRRQGQRDPHAVGVDGAAVNLNKAFVRAVDSVDGGAGNCIVMLMDACLADVAPGQGSGGHGDADDVEPFLAPSRGRNSNLVVRSVFIRAVRHPDVPAQG